MGSCGTVSDKKIKDNYVFRIQNSDPFTSVKGWSIYSVINYGPGEPFIKT